MWSEMVSPLNSCEPLRRVAAGETISADELAGLGRWLLADPGQAGLFGATALNAAEMTAERLRWLPVVWRALTAQPLVVAGYEEQPACVPEELFRFHIPLGQLLIERAGSAASRYLVAIGGVPAGGKSVFAAVMARVLRALRPLFGVATIGLDGYHYSNAYLLAHRTPPGVPEPGALKLYKGAHFTFNTLRLADDLRRLRSTLEPLALPAYDRTVHDPVEGRVVVGSGERLVLVEGNYLLCRKSGWEKVGELFDLRLFLDLPPGANRDRIIARHMRGGRRRADAVRHFERVDLPNTHLVAATRVEADVVVELDAKYAVRALAVGPRGRRTLSGSV